MKNLIAIFYFFFLPNVALSHIAEVMGLTAAFGKFTDYKIKILIDDEEKEIEVKNALKIGERLVLAKIQGGQKYLVLARLKTELFL